MKRCLTMGVIIFVFLSCRHEVSHLPLMEHPRPDFERAAWQNLNGNWKFAADSADAGEKENWQQNPSFFKDEILVPFSWASPMSGIARPDIRIGWYHRSFKTDNDGVWSGINIYLVFGASDFHTKVWINGKYTGEHHGGYVPFEFNISSALKPGENQMVVRVEDQDLDNRPSGKQYYGNARGIWQTVYLEPRDELFISGIRFYPDIDREEVTVRLRLSGPAPAGVVFKLEGKNDNIAFSAPVPAGEQTATFTLPVNDMKLWSPGKPYLYEVTASLVHPEIDDEVKTYFGMRKISGVPVPGRDFSYVALNNEPLYMKMALDQSYHPEGFYTFPSDDFIKEEILRAKKLGLNGLRIHIKAEVPRKLYWADKLGLLIMEDVPNFWGAPTPEAKANWEYIALREIDRDFNHPSIFSWVLFNETWGLFTKDTLTGKSSYLPETQEWVKSWYLKAKEDDPTRLVEDNSPCNLDHVTTDLNTWHAYQPARHWAGLLDEIVSKTYPGSGYNFTGGNLQADQPMFNSECGAVWGYSGSTGDIDITWEYHMMMNEFRKRPKIAGFLFTEFHDVINEWNGYYRFDRTEKIFGLGELCPGMTMNDFHTDLYVVPGDDFYKIYQGGETIQMPFGVSAVTAKIPDSLVVEYSLDGWDTKGDFFSVSKGSTGVTAEPFAFVPAGSVPLQLPETNALMIFSVTLKDNNGLVLHRNFVPFRVKGKDADKQAMVSVSPAAYSDASWSIKQMAPQRGKKVWGIGSGFFEYEFELPPDLDPKETKSLEFRAELAARYPQEKYLEEGDAERIGMTVVSTRGIIPGYGNNSYPQTDEKPFSSHLIVFANGHEIAGVLLPDDPADHRGMLSWMNQEPGWEWGNSDRTKKWLLDEAGSFGYLVKAALDENSMESALKSGKVTIRLQVDETSAESGGLSVYGSESGRYPLDPSIIIKMK